MVIELNSLEKQFPFSNFLQDKMEERKKANRRYSLRAFARDLQISPGRLSDILKGKCLPGAKLCSRMIDKLKLSNGDTKNFFSLLEKQKTVSPFETTKRVYQLREDEFALIADWEHYGILNLLETDEFQSDDAWIAKKLGITVEQTRAAVQRLFRLNLLAVQDGVYTLVHPYLSTSSDIPSAALREAHRQNISMALESLFEDDIAERDITAISFPMDKNNVALAKAEIKKFRIKMARLMTAHSKNKTEVYNLNVQFFPLTKKAQSY